MRSDVKVKNMYRPQCVRCGKRSHKYVITSDGKMMCKDCDKILKEIRATRKNSDDREYERMLRANKGLPPLSTEGLVPIQTYT